MTTTPIDQGEKEICTWRTALEHEIRTRESDPAAAERLLAEVARIAGVLLAEYLERKARPPSIWAGRNAAALRGRDGTNR